MNATAALLLLVGLAIGAVVGYFRTQSRSSARIAVLETELAAARAGAVHDQQAAQREADSQRALFDQILEAERATARERVQAATLTQEQARDMFSALSSDALHNNSKAFMERADELVKRVTTEASGDLDKRQQAIELMVNPLKESLTKVETQLKDVEKERTDSYAALRTQVEHMGKTSEQLRTETTQLVAALRAPQTRGAWGEHQLRQVVEFAGMIEHCDFTEQTSISTDAGSLRPDLIVRLAGGKHVVVDAKVSLVGFLDAMGADGPTKIDHLKRHARHLRDHVDSLGAKAYWDLLPNTPEFVVMFVPAETILNAALETDPSLLQRAFEKNVVIATPATLVALLRTVGYSWRQEALATNAHDVLNLGRELYARLSTMGGHVDKLGKSLTQAVTSYNQTVASLESRVFTTARKLVDLKVTDDELEAPRQIELVPRYVQKPELKASANETLISLPELGISLPELDAPSGDAVHSSDRLNGTDR